MKLLIYLLCIWPFLSMAQQNNKTIYFGEVSYNKVLNSDMPSIKNLPHEIYSYTALDGSQFTSDEKNKPLYYRLPLSLKIGASRTSQKQNVVSVGLSYYHLSRIDTLGGKLRYTDQVDSRSGFVNPSYFQLISGYHIYRTLGLDVDYLFADAIGSYEQRLGFGLGLQRLIGSSYFLNHIDTRNGQNSDFSAHNLTLKDKIWIFNPNISYQGKVYGGDKYDFWLVTSARINVQEKFKVEPLGNILSMAVRVEWK